MVTQVKPLDLQTLVVVAGVVVSVILLDELEEAVL
jgi:hypothetical protein